MSDKQQASNKPRVTMIVTPRERWGMVKLSIESIYASTDVPFELIYIDARSPKHVSDWVKDQATSKGFKIINVNRFVTPTEARNLGAAAATTEFVIFIDNDVICKKGWVAPLLRCADETDADVIAPLVCDNVPVHTRIHQATGLFAKDRQKFFSTRRGDREIVELMVHHGAPIDTVRDKLHRAETDLTEFHCVMVRRSIFDRIGWLDEGMYATKEHYDFCMSVLEAGGKIMFEPESIITYVFPCAAHPMTWEDYPYFLLRWSPEWQVKSLDHLQEKWGLRDAAELKWVRRPDYLRLRQYEGFIKPMIRKMPFVQRSYRLTQLTRNILIRYIDLKVRRLSAEYEKQRAAAKRSTEGSVLRHH